ncbi:hypothetical protein [Cytobacillus sp. IB215316]|uniref:hypothetical protein n=1 Tax=Cytobacillus sp. IB215316 TaxID=3097354 RepID=UPI002A14DB2F|nr:hypothetical protein [Cytobacillus sp. IB215316]MDX8363357.1 hypothetical protein [Cytobacillus sp. IB215316]
MIVDMDVRCHLYGNMFSAKKVEELTGLTLDNKVEVGDIATRGKYKGMPTPYGNGELSPPSEYKEKNDFGLEWISLIMNDYISVFRSCGAENINLVIGVFYEGQCNFSLPSKALKLIGEMEIELQLSCYES